jgi:hypothetical protein
MNYHLAQINIAKLLEPITSPLLEDFVNEIDQINTIAENSPGFVWRQKDGYENEDNKYHFDPELYIVNISVWKTIEGLKNFVYNSGHIEVYRKRAKWFEKMKTPHMALWWINSDHLPTTLEAKNKLLQLETLGDTQEAFSFKCLFENPQKQK